MRPKHHECSTPGTMCLKHHECSAPGTMCLKHHECSTPGTMCLKHHECSAPGTMCLKHHECSAPGTMCLKHHECSAPGTMCLKHYECSAPGKKAIACTIPLRTTVNVSCAKDQNAIEINLLDLQSETIRLTIDTVEIPTTSTMYRGSLCITVRSEIPIGAGLGSSAAFCVALASTLFAFRTKDCPEIASLAKETERFFHGTSSGLDTTTTLGGGLTVAQNGIFNNVKGHDLDFEIFIINMGIRRDTKEMVEKTDSTTKDAIESLKIIANKGIDCILKSEYSKLSDLIQSAQRALVDIGVSNSTIDGICQRLYNRFGLACKISGAGGGGCLVAFGHLKNLPLDEIQEEVSKICPNSKACAFRPSCDGILTTAKSE